MAFSWARNAHGEMALSRSSVRAFNRCRNLRPAWLPLAVLVKKRNYFGSWKVKTPRTMSRTVTAVTLSMPSPPAGPVLAERLHKLVEHSILSTEPYQEAGSRSRLRYVITPKGNDLVPAVLGLLQWGDRYRADPAGPAILARHNACGGQLSVQVRCEHDHHVLATEIEAEPGPGFRVKKAR